MIALLISVLCFSSSIIGVYSFTGLSTRRFASKLLNSKSDEIRTFTSYPIYKSKSALCVKVIPPTFESTGARTRSLSREGVLLLEFAPAVGSTSRAYDWAHKMSFSLSPTECGQFLVGDPSKPIEFFHDPNMKGPEAGKVTKRLKIYPTEQANGCFLSLTVTDKSSGTPTTNTITIPAAWSEIEVIRSIVSYCIPRFLGLNAIWNDGGVPFDPAAAPVAPIPPSIFNTFDEEPSSEAAAPPPPPSSPAATSAPPAAKKWIRK